MSTDPKVGASPGSDVVIAHASDIHVGCDETTRVSGGDETLVLERTLAAARAAACHVVLFAGDVFEHNRLPLALVGRAARLFADANLPVVILPGNHDPAIEKSVWRMGPMAGVENVHVLGVTHDEAVTFPELDLEIWGHAHQGYEDMAPLRQPRQRSTRWQIAMAHGHYEPKPDRAKPLQPAWLIGDDDINATGADYVALGHWNRAVSVGNAKIPAYYSGSPSLAHSINVIRLTAAGEVRVGQQPVAWDQPE
ncbi:MAG: metallophosphoesterase [Alphaproteobacteria bacterium]